MKQSDHENETLSENLKEYRCAKVKCHRSLPFHHPISYTNGLCEQHFFEMNLSINVNNDDIKNMNLNTKSKLLSNDKENIDSIKHQYQPLKNDIRNTREIFDGRQWRIIEQTINQGQTVINNDGVQTKNEIENNLLEIFRLIVNYQTMKDELKVI